MNLAKAPAASRTRILTIDVRAVGGEVTNGGYLTTASGRVVYRIDNVVRLLPSGFKAPMRFRLNLTAVPRKLMPLDVKPATLRDGWRPARNAPSGPLQLISDRSDIATAVAAGDKRAVGLAIASSRSRSLDAQRRRVRALLEDDDAIGRAVPTVRTQEIVGPSGELIRPPTAERAEWRDPDDMAPNRRTVRMVSSWRFSDVLAKQAKINSQINKRHIRAANHLRRDYELGVAGARPGYQRPAIRDASFGPGSGPTEATALALLRYDRARRAVGPLFEILLHVVIGNNDAASYRGMGRQAAGYLLAALDALAEHYEPEEKRTDPC